MHVAKLLKYLALPVTAGVLYLVIDVGSDEARAATPDPSTLFEVKRGTLDITVAEHGTLVARDSEQLVPQIQSQGRITFLVEEGTRVDEGDEVCRLDTKTVADEILELESQILQDESSVDTAKTELEIQEAENEASLEKADLAAKQAKLEVERYRDGDAPQERRKLTIEIKTATSELKKAEKEFDDSKELFKNEYIGSTELEEDQVAYERAVVRKESAELDLTLFNKYTEPMTLAQKQADLRNAERELSTERKRAASKLRQKRVQLETAERQLESRRKQLDDKKEELDNMSLEAPCPGIVLYGDPKRPWMRSEIKVGGSVWGGMTIVTIPDLRVMQVKMKVHEADIQKLEDGLTTTVSMESFPGEVLTGKVTRIAQIAQDSSWDEDSSVKRFDVEITLDGEIELEIRPGISAKAEIFVERREDVLFVPIQCVSLEDGAHRCNVFVDGEAERRTVEVGASNATFVEITSGLEAGDKVLLYNPGLPRSEQADDDDEASEADDGPSATDTAEGQDE